VFPLWAGPTGPCQSRTDTEELFGSRVENNGIFESGSLFSHSGQCGPALVGTTKQHVDRKQVKRSRDEASDPQQHPQERPVQRARREDSDDMAAKRGSDTLGKLLQEQCHRLQNSGNVGNTTLRRHVEAQARDLTWESFTRFMNDMYNRIYQMVNR
jgi:hypothetical protein